jgi:ribosome-associated protein
MMIAAIRHAARSRASPRNGAILRRCLTTTNDDSDDPKDKTENNKQKDNDNDNDDPFTEWIPPSKPLAGDKGHSYEYADQLEEGDHLERLEQELKTLETREEEQQPDWLVTRRQRLQAQQGGDYMTTPAEGRAHKMFLAQIPVKERTLLSREEITSVLESLGGTDVQIYQARTDFSSLSTESTILVTGPTPQQLRSMADALVRQMRARNLQNYGVIGAESGPEGEKGSSWVVVDCCNYIVHMQDAATRALVGLEEIWSGRDSLRRVSIEDEQAFNQYVKDHPIPADYNAQPTRDFDEALKLLQKNRFTVPHRPVVRKEKRVRKSGNRT